MRLECVELARRERVIVQLEWNEHFLEIVLPAWQEYLVSETHLSIAA